MQENLKKKWQVTDEELKAAANELCAKGVGNGCYQNTNALLALMDVLTTGDIPAQAENDEAAHARAGESAPAEEKGAGAKNGKMIRIRVEDLKDGEVKEIETQAAIIYTADDYEPKGEEEGGVSVSVYQNLRGANRTIAIAMKLEKEVEDDRIMKSLLSWKPEGGKE